MAKIDGPIEVRHGEELDHAKITSFLKDAIPGLKGELTIKQFPGGFSNLTYLVTTSNRMLILRRPPFGKKPKSGHDMSREYRILKGLKPVFRYCPEPLIYTEDLTIIGCPFYIMEPIHGLIVRKTLPEGMKLTPDQARTLTENFIKVLCELHSIDYGKAGLSDFGKPEGYVERQVTGWIGRYRDARTPDAPGFEAVMEWLMKKMPGDTTSPCVIHNDYKLDNVVLNPGNPLEIIGVLDWEMATIGDPLMDMGNSIANWVEKDDPPNVQLVRVVATNIEGMLTRKEQIDLYSKIMGRTLDNFDFYWCFGLFKTAVICQQIYYRYYHGQTKDERFKMMIYAVKIVETIAGKVIRHEPFI
jgi:aminoglycoside phosphotransferase (APT) family kinase protein